MTETQFCNGLQDTEKSITSIPLLEIQWIPGAGARCSGHGTAASCHGTSSEQDRDAAGVTLSVPWPQL